MLSLDQTVIYFVSHAVRFFFVYFRDNNLARTNENQVPMYYPLIKLIISHLWTMDTDQIEKPPRSPTILVSVISRELLFCQLFRYTGVYYVQ